MQQMMTLMIMMKEPNSQAYNMQYLNIQHTRTYGVTQIASNTISSSIIPKILNKNTLQWELANEEK
ncbi:hypothetical protein DOY81_005001 [Sarcophaga bullata]|nr:hypothetical protein DOY81_005001 [Sarcophaga bullata]